MKRIPSNRPLDEQRKMRRRILSAMLLVCGGMIGLAILLSERFSMTARIIGFVLVALLGWFVGSDLGKRVSTLEWASKED
jgi:hypothetical protein